jgi:hypothetical protein
MTAVVGLGVDHENDGAFAVCVKGDGFDATGTASHPLSKGFDEAATPESPFTSLSKSISGSSEGPGFVENALDVPKDMKSSLLDFTPFEPPSS